MIATKYVLRIAVAAMAFLIGQLAFTGVQNVFAGVRYVMTYLETDAIECDVGAALPVELPPTTYTDDEAPEPEVGSEFYIAGEYYLIDEALLKGFPDFD